MKKNTNKTNTHSRVFKSVIIYTENGIEIIKNVKVFIEKDALTISTLPEELQSQMNPKSESFETTKPVDNLPKYNKKELKIMEKYGFNQPVQTQQPNDFKISEIK